MTPLHSDALVFFGATGDLAYKKIFPALQAMVKRGHLNVPVIGVSKAGWKLDQLKARARDSVEKHGGLDAPAFEKLSGLLRYVDGDYKDTETFQAIRKELGSAQRPAHYLAIPPVLFGAVVEALGKSGCSANARVIVEKPFGTDLSSARELNRTLLQTFRESSIFRIDHYLGSGQSTTSYIPVSPTRCWSRSGIVTTSKACRLPWRKNLECRGAARSTIAPAPSAT